MNLIREAQTVVGRTIWTAEKVRQLGLVTSLETAAQILGIGRSKAYEMARTGEFPVRLMRVGRVYRVPVNAVLKYLEVD